MLEKNAYFPLVRSSTMIVLKSFSIFYESCFRRKPLIGDDVETQLSVKLPLRAHFPPDSLTNPRISREMAGTLSL